MVETLKFKEPEQKPKAKGRLGKDLVTMSTGTNLLFIYIIKTTIIEIKAILIRKELKNEIIKYNHTF